ncbi:hypothetical protein [Paenibacillus chungangensis]|uniref:Uncharacterized protein n=1 Tax=Paenibacillus chungangensis TaxID=696535 RepID=A0ABW3HMT9_9BACL
MNRREKYSRSRKEPVNIHAKKQSVVSKEAVSSEDRALPSRRIKFPSSTNKISKWYYNIMIVLFLVLVVCLFWYGTTFTHQE